MAVRIVRWRSEDVLKIPIGALFRRGTDWGVFVVTNGRLPRGYRGAPTRDQAGFCRLVLQVSGLLGAAPEIQELDPVIVTTTGPWVVDARIRLGDPPPN